MTSSRRAFLRNLAATSSLALAPRFPFLDQRMPASQIAGDPLRPQFHLLPARNWMNDPNGPIFWRGNYHMFLQYNPNAAVWGDMHWAHAMSPDMIHWKHLPVALEPTLGGPDQDGCFSGSAVLHEGTPTFVYTGVKSVPAADASLRDGTHNFLETQCLATSRDADLLALHKLATPILHPPHDPQLTGFRDPCLWRDKDSWFMGIGSGLRGKGGNVLLYRSKDLRSWDFLRVLATGTSNGKQTDDFVDSGEMWECPDFFPLGKKWVLLYSTERKVFWQVGEFDTSDFVFHPEKRGLLDSGSYYAPKSQLDATNRRVLWGWIPETRPQAEFSAAGWAGCMSLPRVLVLGPDNELNMTFLPELVTLRTRQLSLRSDAKPAEALQRFTMSELACEVELRTRRVPFSFSLSSGSQQLCSVSFDPGKDGTELHIGQSSAGIPSTRYGGHIFQFYFDASVIECIVDHSVALTTRLYNMPRQPIEIRVDQRELASVATFNFWEIIPISKDRLTS